MEELRAAAEAVRQNLNISSFDEKAVQTLAQFIEKERASVPATEQAGVINALGCFLGECIARTFGGHWHRTDSGEVGIRLGSRTFINPFGTVEKQLLHGAVDAVLSLFREVAPTLAPVAVTRRTWIPLPLPPRRSISS
ncbi:hypothetical protein LRS06_05375 [Hymenobacter sp. J193]|uniref:hypothetical protein n=1 Tax=Hymenobacter sp. J193 TaxID=2898429 RepID=UPI002151123B|nr:hypothetical protein [Hymenobacter sp. J193]MCR5887218.1 hypothetical protein [Hymenobacter sp. J193]